MCSIGSHVGIALTLQGTADKPNLELGGAIFTDLPSVA